MVSVNPNPNPNAAFFEKKKKDGPDPGFYWRPLNVYV